MSTSPQITRMKARPLIIRVMWRGRFRRSNSSAARPTERPLARVPVRPITRRQPRYLAIPVRVELADRGFVRRHRLRSSCPGPMPPGDFPVGPNSLTSAANSLIHCDISLGEPGSIEEHVTVKPTLQDWSTTSGVAMTVGSHWLIEGHRPMILVDPLLDAISSSRMR